VAGHARVSMEELRKCFESQGLEKARTYIQSGNVVFELKTANVSGLAEKIEKGIKAVLGLDVSVIVRTREEMSKVIENIPFRAQDQDKSHVTFLSAEPEHVPVKEIEAVKDRTEKFLVSGREVYLHCPNGYGKSKLSNSFFERKLKVSATTRNWRTVNVLYKMASD
jgi:uncharacterized protein (DUF1697 family)